jgi:uncharacterized protein (DUF2062 family)
VPDTKNTIPVALLSPEAPRFAVVMPTYNHGRTLRAVLDSLQPFSLHIFAIDDGSRDDSGVTLKQWQSELPALRTLITHDVNQGKAAALLTGFAAARAAGFTHAITIDSDGQHAASDLPRLLELSRHNPLALIVGARPSKIKGRPWTSQLGRWFSNRCVWLASGVRVSDSQSGLRSYPLESVKHLNAKASRYGFETEILTHAGWAHIPVIETPIEGIYELPQGRITHFRVGKDSWAAVKMHSRLIARALLPIRSSPTHAASVAEQAATTPAASAWRDSPITGSIPARLWWWLGPRRLLIMAKGDALARKSLAASVALGFFMATLPVYGIKTVACLWLSAKLRLHPAVVIAVSSLSTPPLGFVFIVASLITGHTLLHGSAPSMDTVPAWNEINADLLRSLIAELIVGSVVVGALLALVSYIAVRALLRFIPRSP